VDDLRRWVDELAAIERPSASAGERRAAEWVVEQFRGAGVEARVEAERAHGTHLPFALPNLAALIAGLLRSRRATVAAAAVATAAMADEVEGRRRVLRRALAFRRTYNVVAELGPAQAECTLVFVSHHDAARPWSGAFGAIVSQGKPLPLVESLVYGPAAVLAGAAIGSGRLKRAGMAQCAFIVALMADIACRPPVPGANDNASGVAALLGLGRDLAAVPPADVRVLLLSTGSEETMLEGMDAFLRRHRFDPARTLVVCLDQIGWDRLVLRESEGVVRRRRSRAQDLELVRAAARTAGVEIEPAGPFPSPSDGLAARWAGLPTVFISSVAAGGGYPHYHRPTDLPEHVHLPTVEGARRLCAALVRAWPARCAGRRPSGRP
jgi:hypothetical protein